MLKAAVMKREGRRQLNSRQKRWELTGGSMQLMETAQRNGSFKVELKRSGKYLKRKHNRCSKRKEAVETLVF